MPPLSFGVFKTEMVTGIYMSKANGNRPVGDVESQGLPGGVVHHGIVPLKRGKKKKGVRMRAASYKGSVRIPTPAAAGAPRSCFVPEPRDAQAATS